MAPCDNKLVTDNAVGIPDGSVVSTNTVQPCDNELDTDNAIGLILIIYKLLRLMCIFENH